MAAEHTSACRCTSVVRPGALLPSCAVMRTRNALALLLAALLLATCATASHRAGEGPPRNVIVIVWDGLRPDFVGPDTPNLVGLRDSGVDFTDHHSTYPTFTMMNAASLATFIIDRKSTRLNSSH